MFSAALSIFKELLFPVVCLSCEREGAWCCESCLASFSVMEHQRCAVCRHLTVLGETCLACREASALDGITSVFSYHDNQPLARLIKTLKYQLAYECASAVPSALRRAAPVLWNFLHDKPGVVCVPVPLHPRRERERGFNQAQKIAVAFVEVWREQGIEIAVVPGLARVRYTKPQAELGGEARRSNLAEAFAWRDSVAVPRHVVLVDDVFTTGTTMQECARALKRAGAEWVWGVSLARG